MHSAHDFILGLGLEPVPVPVSMQVQHPANQTSINVSIDTLPIAREPERQLKRKPNRPFVDIVYIASFFNTPINLWELLQTMPI